MGMSWFFGFFLVSGASSLIYEVVWLRLSMAQFGVTTPMVSLVLSIFMAGLGLGSLLAGRLPERGAGPSLRRYAAAEGVIALSSVLVPLELRLAGRFLGNLGTSWGSGSHYALAGVLLVLMLLPFCVCMGATFPLAMAAIRRLHAPPASAAQARDRSGRSFSFLYLGNLLGATLGTLGSAFLLIELLGFRGTLRVAGALNLLLLAAAWAWSRRLDGLPGSTAGATADATADTTTAAAQPRAATLPAWLSLGLLLLTGLLSMAMEVVWTRLYTPYLGTVVYAFAAILAIYLLATFFGAQIYRLWASRERGGSLWLYVLVLLAAASLLPLFAADIRLNWNGFERALLRVLVGIGPLCAGVGFLTSLWVDRHAQGDPRRAGTAYAVNIIGCILGPLVAGFLLLPAVSETTALALLSVPLLVAALYVALTVPQATGSPRWLALGLLVASVLPGARLVHNARLPADDLKPPLQVRRD